MEYTLLLAIIAGLVGGVVVRLLSPAPHAMVLVRESSRDRGGVRSVIIPLLALLFIALYVAGVIG